MKKKTNNRKPKSPETLNLKNESPRSMVPGQTSPDGGRQNQPEPRSAEPASPQDDRSQRVTIRFYSPDAQSVAVAGTFNNWQPAATPLERTGEGVWSIELKLEPGSYEYRLVVDNQWLEDPGASRFVSNPFGSLNSVLEV